ncbi:hypothetical protein BVRB_031150, partial [Beta vulgaris subsp. vulgaris]
MTDHHHRKEEAQKDPKKELKHHKHLQHFGKATVVAAGTYAL